MSQRLWSQHRLICCGAGVGVFTNVGLITAPPPQRRGVDQETGQTASEVEMAHKEPPPLSSTIPPFPLSSSIPLIYHPPLSSTIPPFPLPLTLRQSWAVLQLLHATPRSPSLRVLHASRVIIMTWDARSVTVCVICMCTMHINMIQYIIRACTCIGIWTCMCVIGIICITCIICIRIGIMCVYMHKCYMYYMYYMCYTHYMYMYMYMYM